MSSERRCPVVLLPARVAVRVAASVAALVFALAALPGVAHGQSLYGTNGTAATVNEMTGPPILPCLYPNGPPISSFPYGVPGPCTPPSPFLPPPGSLFGDVTVDKVNDLIYMADGQRIGVFSRAGAQLNVMPVVPAPILITGLGFDSSAGKLWLSDGTLVYNITPSPLASCLPATVNTFFAPAGLGVVTDVAWHPGPGLVYCCDSAGLIAAYTPLGVLSVGPYVAFGLSCGLTAPLTGIAADTSSGCNSTTPRIYVTDGSKVSYEFSGGLPGPSKFYTPVGCFPYSGAPTQGLGFAARAITYGTGTGPQIGSINESILPSPNFKITLTSAPPLGQAYLVVGTGAACPPLSFFGQPWYVSPFSLTFGPFPISAAGTFTMNAPLPIPGNGVPCGASIYMQWFCKSTGNVWTSSQGLEFTASLP